MAAKSPLDTIGRVQEAWGNRAFRTSRSRASPRRVRATLMAQEAKVLERMKMHTRPGPLYLIDGDQALGG